MTRRELGAVKAELTKLRGLVARAVAALERIVSQDAEQRAAEIEKLRRLLSRPGVQSRN